jgi:predicted secreted acid phosphatase
MGVPTSEIGYTTAMPRREDHEVHKAMWWRWIKKKYAEQIAGCTVFKAYLREEGTIIVFTFN